MFLDEIIYYNLDNTNSLLYICKNNGFSILQFSPFTIKETIVLDGGIKRVVSTDIKNQYYIVGGGKHPFKPMNQVHLYDMNTNKIIYSISIHSIISDISYSCNHIIITCGYEIFIYNTNTYTLYKKIALHTTIQSLAFPIRDICHTIYIQKQLLCLANTSSEMNTVKLDNEVSYYTIDKTNTYFIEVDIYGKFITLYTIEPFEKKITYQRGNSPSEIYSIQLTHDCKYMICISSTNTLHLFKLRQRYTYFWSFEKSIYSIHLPNKGKSILLFINNTYSFVCIDIVGNCNFLRIEKESIIIEKYLSIIKNKDSPFHT
jgi:WD40 repeat protein